MKFDELIQKLLKEITLVKRYPEFSANLTQGPSRDGILPNGGGDFMGNINKSGPNTLVGDMWYQRNPKESKPKKTSKKK